MESPRAASKDMIAARLWGEHKSVAGNVIQHIGMSCIPVIGSSQCGSLSNPPGREWGKEVELGSVGT